LASIVIVCVLGLGLPGWAQASTTAAPPALEQALDRLVTDGVPGAIALQRQGAEEWYAASGVADLKTKEPISATDRFRIGSMTKGFVSTVVLQFGPSRGPSRVRRRLGCQVPSFQEIKKLKERDRSYR